MPTPVRLQQLGFSVSVIHVPDSFQIDRTGRDLPCRGANVFGAVAETHRRKILGRARRQRSAVGMLLYTCSLLL